MCVLCPLNPELSVEQGNYFAYLRLTVHIANCKYNAAIGVFSSAKRIYNPASLLSQAAHTMSLFKVPKNQRKPIATKQPYTQTHHGIRSKDDYHWLRADNWQEAMRHPAKLPEDIKQYLQAENTYFKLLWRI